MIIFICFIVMISVPILSILLTCNKIGRATRELKDFGEKIKNKYE